MLEVKGLSKLLGVRRVLHQLDLRVESGEIVAVRGPNGSGKSTLLRTIAGILEPDAGEVVVCGASLHADRARALANVGYVPEGSELAPYLTVRETAALIAALRSAGLPEPTMAERLGVDALWGERIGTLSLGQRRRAGLLLATIGDPPVLLLDEPSNGLDAASHVVLCDWLAERAKAGRAVVCATHDPELIARAATRQLVFRDGKLEATE